mmetsp:Transcript_50719/g.158456  ORF Transcript_50719/g.158456 Transcript_50719/m.158456 type:complete len:232 (-) Transcript_50719:595-1290(-)
MDSQLDSTSCTPRSSTNPAWPRTSFDLRPRSSKCCINKSSSGSRCPTFPLPFSLDSFFGSCSSRLTLTSSSTTTQSRSDPLTSRMGESTSPSSTPSPCFSSLAGSTTYGSFSPRAHRICCAVGLQSLSLLAMERAALASQSTSQPPPASQMPSRQIALQSRHLPTISSTHLLLPLLLPPTYSQTCSSLPYSRLFRLRCSPGSWFLSSSCCSSLRDLTCKSSKNTRRKRLMS